MSTSIFTRPRHERLQRAGVADGPRCQTSRCRCIEGRHTPSNRDDCGISVSGLTMSLRGELGCLARDEITRAGGQLVTDAMQDEYASLRSRIAIVDVDSLDFVDAAGLGALVAPRQTLTEAGLGLGTRHPSPRLRLSAICRLDQTLGLQPECHDRSGATR